MPIFTVALLMPIVRMKSFILSFCRAKTCSTADLIFDRRPFARDIVSGIGLPFGFRWWMSDFRPFLASHSSLVLERYALSAQTVEAVLSLVTTFLS